MNFPEQFGADDALALLDSLLGSRRLKDLQQRVFIGTWRGQTYPQIAEQAGYDTGHIRDVGAELWQMIGEALGEKVTKNNIHTVLRRHRQLPAEKSTDSLPAPTVALPAAPNPLVGRQDELSECARLLVTSARLLTLFGPGGAGKTRLAVQLAEQVKGHFPGGVFFVPLAAVRDPALVATAIAVAIGLRPEAGDYSGPLKAFLSEQAVLLVLDNFEHLQPAALLVSELLSSAPRLRVLVTSRTVLRVYGEHEYSVAPLALPPAVDLPPEELSASTAVALFVQRARSVRPDFTLTPANARAVAELCVRLDGLPLAIELAAARVKLLPPEALLARLGQRFSLLVGGARDLPAHQQTLRGTLDWSFELLAEPERKLFARLGVFMGGGSLEAVETIANADGDLDVLESLGVLLDNSLLVCRDNGGEARYAMLETVHEYAQGVLAHTEELSCWRSRHADYFLALAQQAEGHFSAGSDLERWFDRLETEHDNLRAALRWYLATGEATKAALLGASIWLFWEIRGHSSEGAGWLEKVLMHPEIPAATRAKALNGLGALLENQGEYQRAVATFEQSLALWRELDYERGIGAALNNLGSAMQKLGETNRAIALFEESLALKRRSGHKSGIAHTLGNLAVVYARQCRYEQAEALFEESLALDRELNNAYGIAVSLQGLADIARLRGRRQRAGQLYRESLQLHRRLDDKVETAQCLEGLALVELERNPEQATRFAAAAAALRTAAHVPLTPTEQVCFDESLERLRHKLGTAFQWAWRTGQRTPLESVVADALVEPPAEAAGL